MPLFKESAKGLVFRQQDQGGREPPPIGSVGLDQLKDEVKFGLVPVGSVIAVMSHLSGVASLPASGVASNGWMRCDGSVIPSGQTLSGTLPDLTSGRFIYGTSGAGAGNNPLSGGTGGTNSVTITSANLPTHTHVIDHGHAGSFATSSHTHNMEHIHQWATSASADGGPFESRSQNTAGWGVSSGIYNGNSGGVASSNIVFTGTIKTPSPYTLGAGFLSMVTGQRYYTTGALSDFSNLKANTGTASASGSVTGFTGSSGDGGFANTALNITPSYVAAVYLIRVK